MAYRCGEDLCGASEADVRVSQTKANLVDTASPTVLCRLDTQRMQCAAAVTVQLGDGNKKVLFGLEGSTQEFCP